MLRKILKEILKGRYSYVDVAALMVMILFTIDNSFLGVLITAILLFFIKMLAIIEEWDK